MTGNNLKNKNPLIVWDRLEIGPVKVERRRLSVPYRIVFDGKEDSINLLYTYEENVFDPGDEASQNLAGMIGAQLALNYGLFCKRMVFHMMTQIAAFSWIWLRIPPGKFM